jgi:hypothetical protein
MRAGPYAEYGGRVFRCSNPQEDRLLLLDEGAAPRPDGFGLNRWSEWSRLVDRHEVTRLTIVRTWADWRGHRVRVERVFDSTAEALVEHQGSPRPEGANVWTVDRDVWQAKVPLGELTDVVEDPFDVPV